MKENHLNNSVGILVEGNLDSEFSINFLPLQSFLGHFYSSSGKEETIREGGAQLVFKLNEGYIFKNNIPDQNTTKMLINSIKSSKDFTLLLKSYYFDHEPQFNRTADTSITLTLPPLQNYKVDGVEVISLDLSTGLIYPELSNYSFQSFFRISKSGKENRLPSSTTQLKVSFLLFSLFLIFFIQFQ